MRRLRILFVFAFAMLFVIATNRCLVAAAFPCAVEECCPGEELPENSTDGQPCDADCAPCATLESGVNLAALVPFALTAPVWTDDVEFAELMRRLALSAMQQVAARPPDPAAIPPPPWCDVMTKAMPVRGPSLVA